MATINVQTRSIFLLCIFRILAEYGDLQGQSPYSVQKLESTDQQKVRT